MGTDGAYVIVKASKKVIVTAYTLTTGNDNASWGGRNPKSWVFSGCNDYDEANVNSGSWKAIASPLATTLTAVTSTTHKLTVRLIRS